MSPTLQPFLELLPLSAIIAIVYCTMKEDGAGRIARASALFFVRMYGGIILFSAGIYLLCWTIRTLST